MEHNQDEPQSNKLSARPIAVRDITVQTGRIACTVVIAQEQFRYSSPKLAAFLADQFPDLPHHACVNDEGKTFGDVMEKTSVPHMLEHVVISIQARNDAKTSKPFIGTTEWVEELAGEALVTVSFRDDLEALRAFNEATRFLNMAVLTCLA